VKIAERRATQRSVTEVMSTIWNFFSPLGFTLKPPPLAVVIDCTALIAPVLLIAQPIAQKPGILLVNYYN